MEVTAHFVHAVATQYEAHYTKLTAAKAEADAEGGGGGDEAAMEKQCANLAAVLSYLYICKAVHSTMLMDILRRHLDVFGDADVELILVRYLSPTFASTLPMFSALGCLDFENMNLAFKSFLNTNQSASQRFSPSSFANRNRR